MHESCGPAVADRCRTSVGLMLQESGRLRPGCDVLRHAHWVVEANDEKLWTALVTSCVWRHLILVLVSALAANYLSKHLHTKYVWALFCWAGGCPHPHPSPAGCCGVTGLRALVVFFFQSLWDRTGIAAAARPSRLSGFGVTRSTYTPNQCIPCTFAE